MRGYDERDAARADVQRQAAELANLQTRHTGEQTAPHADTRGRR